MQWQPRSHNPIRHTVIILCSSLLYLVLLTLPPSSNSLLVFFSSHTPTLLTHAPFLILFLFFFVLDLFHVASPVAFASRGVLLSGFPPVSSPGCHPASIRLVMPPSATSLSLPIFNLVIPSSFPLLPLYTLHLILLSLLSFVSSFSFSFSNLHLCFVVLSFAL